MPELPEPRGEERAPENSPTYEQYRSAVVSLADDIEAQFWTQTNRHIDFSQQEDLVDLSEVVNCRELAGQRGINDYDIAYQLVRRYLGRHDIWGGTPTEVREEVLDVIWGDVGHFDYRKSDQQARLAKLPFLDLGKMAVPYEQFVKQLFDVVAEAQRESKLNRFREDFGDHSLTTEGLQAYSSIGEMVSHSLGNFTSVSALTSGVNFVEHGWENDVFCHLIENYELEE